MRSPKVYQGEEQFMKFDSGPTTLVSTGFDICFGVVILAPGGVILGHYNPTMALSSGDQRIYVPYTRTIKTVLRTPVHISTQVLTRVQKLTFRMVWHSN